MMRYDAFFQRIKRSKFRSSFHLKEKEKTYVREKGLDVIEKHAYDFILQRLSAKEPVNDGVQTPMKGHPVFIAQHATGTCCRGCLEKWHRIPKDAALTQVQIEYIVSIVMIWIEKEVEDCYEY